jgi:4-diphosphocytidyl-2-C-methyl-D-erythritol kinase
VTLTARARAKINLFLHAGTRRADGYHSLASWAAFTEIGDDLGAETATGLSLGIDGPFAAQLPPPTDNLILKAAAALAPGRGAALRLTKHLPVASGIGGGSADAAAALHILNELWHLETPFETLFEIAATLGSDVPVCVYNRSALMGGRGEQLSAGPDLPPLPVVLLNPGVPVSTAAVFGHLSQRTGAVLPRLPDTIIDAAHLASVLAPTKNDLEAPAIAIAPEIATALEALRAQPGILIARMSGSGATCFALATDEAAASTAALNLKRARPDWWLAATRLDC